MPNSDSLQVIAQGRLIQTVDDKRAATDRFKLLPADRTLFDTRLDDLVAKDNDTALTESNRAGGSGAARTALEKLEGLLREGYHGITAIRSAKITDAERLEVHTAYGWVGGNLGLFNDARTLGLARLALDEDLEIEKPEWEYAADLKTDIAAQLALFDKNADDRTGGDRMDATKVRNGALELFLTMLSRVRHYLCSASDDVDQSPELRRCGFKVRKARAPKAKPAPAVAPGTTPPK